MKQYLFNFLRPIFLFFSIYFVILHHWKFINQNHDNLTRFFRYLNIYPSIGYVNGVMFKNYYINFFTLNMFLIGIMYIIELIYAYYYKTVVNLILCFSFVYILLFIYFLCFFLYALGVIPSDYWLIILLDK